MNTFIFVRMVVEIIGLGKYLPAHGLYTAETFAAAFNRAAAWGKEEGAQGILSAERGCLSLWVHGSTVRQEEGGSAALMMLGGQVVVGPQGFYESSPEASILAAAQAVVEYDDVRLLPEKRAEVREVYAETLEQFVELFPVSRAVTAQVRNTLGDLIKE